MHGVVGVPDHVVQVVVKRIPRQCPAAVVLSKDTVSSGGMSWRVIQMEPIALQSTLNFREMQTIIAPLSLDNPLFIPPSGQDYGLVTVTPIGVHTMTITGISKESTKTRDRVWTRFL